MQTDRRDTKKSIKWKDRKWGKYSAGGFSIQMRGLVPTEPKADVAVGNAFKLGSLTNPSIISHGEVWKQPNPTNSIWILHFLHKHSAGGDGLSHITGRHFPLQSLSAAEASRGMLRGIHVLLKGCFCKGEMCLSSVSAEPIILRGVHTLKTVRLSVCFVSSNGWICQLKFIVHYLMHPRFLKVSSVHKKKNHTVNVSMKF